MPKDGDPAVFGALSEAIGRPINEYAGGDPDKWIAAMNQAFEWDEAHDNTFTPKSKAPALYEQTRKGLVSLRDNIAGRKDKIHELRKQNGLEH